MAVTASFELAVKAVSFLLVHVSVYLTPAGRPLMTRRLESLDEGDRACPYRVQRCCLRAGAPALEARRRILLEETDDGREPQREPDRTARGSGAGSNARWKRKSIGPSSRSFMTSLGAPTKWAMALEARGFSSGGHRNRC
jgi:hypothetical protein